MNLIKMFFHQIEDPISIYRLKLIPGCKFNVNFITGFYSFGHFGLSVLGVIGLYILSYYSLSQSFWAAWCIGILWDILDMIKKGWWTQESKNASFLNQHLFYSDGFSWSDVFVFDLGGCFTGFIISSFL